MLYFFIMQKKSIFCMIYFYVVHHFEKRKSDIYIF